MRSMGEGHALAILTFWRGDTLNVPLHRLRRSPSPGGGGKPRLCLNLGTCQTPLTPFRGRGVGGEGARACAISEGRWMVRGGD
jgi:hypothetical protein